MPDDVKMEQKPPKTAASHWHGHRARLKSRFLKAVKANATDVMPDYELLEILLFSTLPRSDVKPLAKALIERFHSLGGVVAADPEALTSIPGIKSGALIAIKAVQAAMCLILREEVLNKPIFSSWPRLLDYCRAAAAYSDVEQFRVLFLDCRNRLLQDEIQQKGTIDHTPAYPREIVRRALDFGAGGIILLHNHPSGDPKPSKADIEMTRQICAAARPVGITVIDHLIVARSGHYSFKANQLL